MFYNEGARRKYRGIVHMHILEYTSSTSWYTIKQRKFTRRAKSCPLYSGGSLVIDPGLVLCVVR